MNTSEFQRRRDELEMLERERRDMEIEDREFFFGPGLIFVVLVIAMAAVAFGIVEIFAPPAHGATPIILDGYVARFQVKGRIGVRINGQTGKIDKVHTVSPAHEAGLLPGDIVETVDGQPYGKVNIEGLAGEPVLLQIRRDGLPQFMTVDRVPIKEIRD